MSRKLERKPYDWIIPRSNVRRTASPEADEQLLTSMQANGILVPFIATSRGDLLDGYRRYALMLKAGIKEVDVLITDEEWSQFKTDAFQLANAIHRQAVAPHDQYLVFRRWLEEDKNLTVKAIADLVSLDPSEVSRICSLARCVEAVQSAASDGKLGPSVWSILASQSPKRQEVLFAMHLGGVSREALRRSANKPDSLEVAAEPPAKVQKLKVPVPGKWASVTVESEKDFDLGGYLEILIELVKQVRKSETDILTTSSFQQVMRDRNKAHNSRQAATSREVTQLASQRPASGDR
jgi:ParB/RepB/Spo0J family partition protein